VSAIILIDDARYADLMKDDEMKLTQEEISAGWHFCPEWDGLLIGPGMDEFDYCCPCGVGGRCDILTDQASNVQVKELPA